MKDVRANYTSQLYREFGYFPTWEPDMQLKLGDIGILRNNEFTRISSLSDEKINFRTKTDSTIGDLEYQTPGKVSVITTVGTRLETEKEGRREREVAFREGEFGIVVQFKDYNAVFFNGRGIKTLSIENQSQVGNEIIKRYKDGRWNKDFVVITELVTADCATILVSNSNVGRLDLLSKDSIHASRVDLANPKAKFETAFMKDIHTKLICARDLTPLFRIKGIKSHFSITPQLAMRGVTALDLLTPARAAGDMQDYVYFGNINFVVEPEEAVLTNGRGLYGREYVREITPLRELFPAEPPSLREVVLTR